MDTIVSDCAANFNSKVVKALCDTFNIRHINTSLYSPSTNGQIERMNSLLTQCLRTLCSDTPHNWDLHLQSVMMAFRMSPWLNSTGYSPFYLLTGQHMQLPLDYLLDYIPKITGCPKQYIEDMAKNLQIIRDTAKNNLQKHKALFKKYYDRKTNIPNFRVGDHVYVTVEHIPVGVSRKLYPRYSGPFYIVHKGKNHSYKLCHARTNKLLKYTVHANRLKLYKDPRDCRQDRFVPYLQNPNHNHATQARPVPTQPTVARDPGETMPLSNAGGQQTGIPQRQKLQTERTGKKLPNAQDRPPVREEAIPGTGRSQNLTPETRPLLNTDRTGKKPLHAQDRPPEREEAPPGTGSMHNFTPETVSSPQNEPKAETGMETEGNISQDKTSENDIQHVSQENEDTWYEAEKLLKSKWVSGRKYYLVQWTDKTAQPSWELESNITPLLIQQYHINNSKTPRRKKRPQKR